MGQVTNDTETPIVAGIVGTDYLLVVTAVGLRRILKSSLVIDEDDMASDSSGKVPTQQSVKAYVDAVAAAIVNAAEDVTVADAGSFFAGTDVEAVLQELGLGLANVSIPGVDAYSAEPQELVLDRVFTPADLTAGSGDFSYPTDDVIVADSNRALPAGSVNDVVAAMPGANAGIYVITDLGSGASPWILTRHTDYDTVAELHRPMVFPLSDGGSVLVTVDTSEASTVATSDESYAVVMSAGLLGGSVPTGFGTYASGYYAHAEGGETIAAGSVSHAEGSETEALGNYSHAEGASSRATADSSHVGAGGRFAAKGDAQYERHYMKASGAGQMYPGAVLPSGWVAGFRALVVAEGTSGDVVSAWSIVGTVSFKGTIRVIGTPTVTMIGQDAGASGWAATATILSSALAVSVSGTGIARTFATVEFSVIGATT